jgi:hypothetical protein
VKASMFTRFPFALHDPFAARRWLD